VESLKSKELVALQAPTGSGKTIFSLMVALSVKSKALFIVRTHNQFYSVFREARRLNKSFGFLVGKANACAFTNEDVDSNDIECRGCPIHSAIKVEFKEQPASLVKKLKGLALTSGFCPYYSIVESSLDSEVLAITYPYVFSPWLREAMDLDFSERVIIVDEAHNLDYIAEMSERRISRHTVTAAISQCTGEQTKVFLSELLKRFYSLPEARDGYVLVEEPLEVSDDELELLQDEYESIRAKMIEQRKVTKNYVGVVLRFLNSLREQGRRLFANGDSLVSRNPDPASYLKVLNEPELSIIIMSGTLPPKEYIESVWGLTRKMSYFNAEVLMERESLGRKEWILAVDVTTSYSKRNETMWSRYASYLMRIYHTSKANVLALVPSYEVARKLIGKLTGVRVIAEKERTSMEDLSHAVKEGKSLIIAVGRGKLAEGIELTEEGRSLISDIALVGIPFPFPDDYNKLRAQAIASRVGRAKEEMLTKIPALITVRQAIGRAIRGPNDSATIWLLDSRYDNPWWKSRLGYLNPRKIVL